MRSMNFDKQEDVTLSLAEAFWNLVIVDEVHKVALMRWRESKNTKIQVWRTLVQKFKLSSVPHNKCS